MTLNQQVEAATVNASMCISHCEVCGTVAESQKLQMQGFEWLGYRYRRMALACCACSSAADTIALRTHKTVSVNEVREERSKC